MIDATFILTSVITIPFATDYYKVNVCTVNLNYPYLYILTRFCVLLGLVLGIACLLHNYSPSSNWDTCTETETINFVSDKSTYTYSLYRTSELNQNDAGYLVQENTGTKELLLYRYFYNLGTYSKKLLAGCIQIIEVIEVGGKVNKVRYSNEDTHGMEKRIVCGSTRSTEFVPQEQV